MTPRLFIADSTPPVKYMPALTDQDPMQECEWIKPECSCTDYITYDPTTGYKCEACGDRQIRDPNDETKCMEKTCTGQVMGTRNECYTCMDCQKGSKANLDGECEKLICDHNKSPFETCQIQVHCACNDRLDRLPADDASEPDNISIFSYEYTETEPEEGADGKPVIGADGKAVMKTETVTVKYTCSPCPNGTRPSRDGESCVSVHCSVW